MKNICLIGWNNKINNVIKSIIITPFQGLMVFSLIASIKITSLRDYLDSLVYVHL